MSIACVRTQHPSAPAALVKRILGIPSEKLHVIVSHGHDDHLDEFFIRAHLREATFYVPHFQKGLAKRIERLTGKAPTEVSPEGCPVGDLSLHAFIDREGAPHDATFVIKGRENAIIHGNDNWHAYPSVIAAQIRACVSTVPPERVSYFVQFGIADCFPLNYTGMDDAAVAAAIAKRFSSYLNDTTVNAGMIGVAPHQRFYYANQSKYDYPDHYAGPTLYDRAQDFLKQTDSSFKQCIPGTQPGSGERPPEDDVFRFCLKRLEEMANRELKSDVGVRFIAKPDAVDRSAICYQASDVIWRRILIGDLTLEAISIGGCGFVHKPAELNMASVHHQISKIAYILQNRILANGLRFYLGD